MAIKFIDISPKPEKAKAKERPAAKIMRGLEEALQIAKGEAEPAKWHFRERAPNGTFDRKAYMREYMKARRAKQREEN